nr:MAG TPA: hypothetical protein [Caudoviricetes sp.]
MRNLCMINMSFRKLIIIIMVKEIQNSFAILKRILE